MLGFCIHHWKDMVKSWINLKVREFGKRMQRTSRSHHSRCWFFWNNSLLMLSHHLLQFILAFFNKIIFFLFCRLRLNWRFFLFDWDCLLNIHPNTFLWKLFKFFLFFKPFYLLFCLLSNMNPIILIITFFLYNLFFFSHLYHLNIILWMVFNLSLLYLFIFFLHLYL